MEIREGSSAPAKTVGAQSTGWPKKWATTKLSKKIVLNQISFLCQINFSQALQLMSSCAWPTLWHHQQCLNHIYVLDGDLFKEFFDFHIFCFLASVFNARKHCNAPTPHSPEKKTCTKSPASAIEHTWRCTRHCWPDIFIILQSRVDASKFSFFFKELSLSGTPFPVQADPRHLRTPLRLHPRFIWCQQ